MGGGGGCCGRVVVSRAGHQAAVGTRPRLIRGPDPGHMLAVLWELLDLTSWDALCSGLVASSVSGVVSVRRPTTD